MSSFISPGLMMLAVPADITVKCQSVIKCEILSHLV